jgi:hypothetical protein
MSTTIDSATLDGGNGPETWFGVEAPFTDGQREIPSSGWFSWEGDIASVEVLAAAVITQAFEFGDPGFHVRLKIPHNNAPFTVTCTVESTPTPAP